LETRIESFRERLALLCGQGISIHPAFPFIFRFSSGDIMKLKCLIAVAAAGLMTLATGAMAAAPDGAQVVKEKNCLMCHNMAGRKIGPGFKETAAKYHGKAGAQAQLVKEIQNAKPHPKLSTQISTEELNAAVKYVLETK
jgi:cytochrome c